MDRSAYNKRYEHYLSCKSKETLRLENGFCFDIPVDACFPNLKVLELGLRVPDLGYLDVLLGKCPSLEDLSVSATCLPCDDDIEYTLTFSVPTLKRLKFHLDEDNFGGCWPHVFIIKTPNLESLVILDFSLSCFVIDEIPSTLNEAVLVLGQSNYVHGFGVSKDEARRAMQALKGVRNATTLCLGSGTTSALSYSFEDGHHFPTFPYLLRLELDIDHYFGWKLLPYFLENSPLLHFLELNRESEWTHAIEMDEEDLEEPDDVNTFGWTPPKDVPLCLINELEEIKVRNLWRHEAEGEVVKYLVENGKALKKVSIKFDKDSIGREIDENTIENFPRGSNKCEIDFF